MEDVFERRKNGGGGIFFVEKFKNGGRDPIFFMVGTFAQHAWHAKSPSLILCTHPLGCLVGLEIWLASDHNTNAIGN